MNERGTILMALVLEPGERGIFNLEAVQTSVTEFGNLYGLNLDLQPETYGVSQFRSIVRQPWADTIATELLWGIWAPEQAPLTMINQDLEACFGRTKIIALGLRETRTPEAAYHGLIFKKTDDSEEGPGFRLSLQAATLHGYMLFTREHGLRLEGPPVLNEPTMILDDRLAEEPPGKWTWGIFVLGGSHDWAKIQEQLTKRFGEKARLST